MEYNILFWLYTIIGVLIINHRADSAYFHEWELITKRHSLRIGLYIAVHLAGLAALATGFILLYQKDSLGVLWAIAECVFCWVLIGYHRMNAKSKKDDEYSDFAGTVTFLLLLVLSLVLFVASIYVAVR